MVVYFAATWAMDAWSRRRAARVETVPLAVPVPEPRAAVALNSPD